MAKAIKMSIQKAIQKIDTGNNIHNLCPSEKELIFYPINFGLTWECFKAKDVAQYCAKTEKKEAFALKQQMQDASKLSVTPRTSMLLGGDSTPSRSIATPHMNIKNEE